MSGLWLHLPSSLPGFGTWLATHWPAARHGCQWQYGGKVGHLATWTWQRICQN